MSAHYTTEPAPAASVLLHTTAGPIPISLFATQTPLTCRNFLQLVLDGYYENVLFHRVSPGFVVQTGDPTGTGVGGESIYEQREFERYDGAWARYLKGDVTPGEKVVLRDEIHSRLKFNRRGLVGMAKMDGGGYGSQFFITLGDVGGALDGRCTMFGRVEGEGIYNVVKIGEGELAAEGSERPMFPERILRAEVLEMPMGEPWAAMKARDRVQATTSVDERGVKRKKVAKPKGGKGLLSFGGEEGEDGDAVAVKPKKAKFNTALIDGGHPPAGLPTNHGRIDRVESPLPTRRKYEARESHSQEAAISKDAASTHQRRPSFHDSTTQLPLRDPESPSRPATPVAEILSSPHRTNQVPSLSLSDEIAALKASLRSDVAPTKTTKPPKSALEQLIPATSTRGRRRPRPGETSSREDARALSMLQAFQARLESTTKKDDYDTNGRKANGATEPDAGTDISTDIKPSTSEPDNGKADDDEATLCDLHFIANCQSCSKWDDFHNAHSGLANSKQDNDADEGDGEWMSHALSFARDRLGKDLTWKRKHEEELVVIDPREKEKSIMEKERERKAKRKGEAR